MNKDERMKALRALAKKHPYAATMGFMWKNPLNPRSLGIRWTTRDMEIFKAFQAEYK
jgi:hypothetical protein